MNILKKIINFRYMISLLLINSTLFTSLSDRTQEYLIRLIPTTYAQRGMDINFNGTKLFERGNITCYVKDEELYVFVNNSVFYEEYLRDNKSLLDSLKEMEKYSKLLHSKSKEAKLKPMQIDFYNRHKSDPVVCKAVQEALEILQKNDD